MVRHSPFGFCPLVPRSLVGEPGDIVTKYPAKECNQDRILAATSPVGAGTPRRLWRKVVITSGRPKTTKAQMPAGRPRSQAGDHGKTARRAAATQSGYQRPRI